VEVDCIDI